MDSPAERQQGTSPLTNVHHHCTWKLSPRDHNGSTLLFDSFELQAVTKQLNRAIHGSNGTLSPYSSYLKSPFYNKQLDRIYKENARNRKRIACAKLGNAKGTRGLVLRIWEKVKQKFARNKQADTTS